MCTALPCRSNASSSACVSTEGIGAAVGSTCDSGKICDQGVCVSNAIAPTGNCVFGDDVITELNSNLPFPLPNAQNNCSDVITYISSMNQFPIAYCASNLIFQKTCCQTCQSIIFK